MIDFMYVRFRYIKLRNWASFRSKIKSRPTKIRTIAVMMEAWTRLPTFYTLPWRHNGRDGVSNHRHLHSLLNCLFRRSSKKTSKLRVTGLCEGNSPVTGEFPTQKASNAETVSFDDVIMRTTFQMLFLTNCGTELLLHCSLFLYNK